MSFNLQYCFLLLIFSYNCGITWSIQYKREGINKSKGIYIYLFAFYHPPTLIGILYSNCILKFPNKFKCDKCSTYQSIGIKIIKCIDCGKDIEVDACDMKTCRCKECQHIEDKRIKLEYYHRTKKLKKS